MKKLIFAIALFFPLLIAGQSVEQYIQLLQNDSSEFRFQTVEVRSYEDFNDTLIVDIFPDRWLDSISLEQFQEQLISQLEERQEALRGLFVEVRNKIQYHVQVYDAIHGDGAWITKEKEKMLAALQGEWVLIDRVNGNDPVRRNINIEGTRFVLNANKEGSIIITDDLEMMLTGFYPFDLTFSMNRNGILRADRGNRIFALRK